MSGSSKLPRLQVAVLLGGKSAEREVSLKSGRAVAAALHAAGHRVCEIDPAVTNLAEHDWKGIDVAFLALHGTHGEDGSVQKLLEQAGISYTGSGPAASARAFSKLLAKQHFVQRGVPTAPWISLTRADTESTWSDCGRRLGWPLVVKPDQQGSSIGVTIVRSEEFLADAVRAAFELGNVCLLEQAIEGHEWTVGLLDSQPLPPIRIGTSRAFFDYEAKYVDEGTQYLFEDPAPASTAAMVTRIAGDACAALGTCGVARVDLMVDRFQRPFVLEVNTIPGFTDHSLVPKAAAHAGISFVELCEWCLISARQHTTGRRAA